MKLGVCTAVPAGLRMAGSDKRPPAALTRRRGALTRR
jgi:hypothetical protein